MQLEKKAINLIFQKYRHSIIVSQNKKDSTFNSILDSNNGTLLNFSTSQYTFKDKDGNFWLTIPKNLIINGEKYYPVVGDSYICDEIKYSFCTKEFVVAMAADYFEYFVDHNYAVKIKENYHVFIVEKKIYSLPHNCFKVKIHNKKTRGSISFN